MNYVELLTIERDAALAQNAELVAQVDRQQTYINGLKCMIERYSEVVAKQCRKEAWHEDHPLVQISTMTPTQCLNQIRADSGRAGYMACAAESGFCGTDSQIKLVGIYADKYAERVKAGE